jgi:hypothetical protein
MGKKIKEVCGNCLLYDGEKKHCKIAVLINGEEMHMPVKTDDKCHFDELDIPIEQVRWYVEDNNGNRTEGDGNVKIEYPEGFFGK